MSEPIEYVVYSDATGKEYTETCTSPISVAIREDELEAAGYRIIR